MYMSCTHVFGILLAAQLAEERPLPTRQEDPANLPTWWHGSSRQFAQKSQSACMQASNMFRILLCILQAAQRRRVLEVNRQTLMLSLNCLHLTLKVWLDLSWDVFQMGMSQKFQIVWPGFPLLCHAACMQAFPCQNLRTVRKIKLRSCMR